MEIWRRILADIARKARLRAVLVMGVAASGLLLPSLPFLLRSTRDRRQTGSSELLGRPKDDRARRRVRDHSSLADVADDYSPKGKAVVKPMEKGAPGCGTTGRRCPGWRRETCEPLRPRSRDFWSVARRITSKYPHATRHPKSDAAVCQNQAYQQQS